MTECIAAYTARTTATTAGRTDRDTIITYAACITL
jgi:hypothetical protein